MITIDGVPVRTDLCRSCTGRVIWARTVNGRSMPVDAEPNGGGNVVLTCQGPGKVRALVLGSEDRPPEGKARRTSHFATCPQASGWRKR